MALSTAFRQEIRFPVSSETTALYLVEFQRLFSKTQAEIERQRQSQLDLARLFFEQAIKRFHTRPSQVQITQLLMECMNHHALTHTEPAVLTMETATALSMLACQPNEPRFFSSGIRDFLTEAGILPLEPWAVTAHQPVSWISGTRVTDRLR